MLPSAYALDHVGFTVPDLDEALRFFVDVLGCEVCYRETPVDAPDDDTMRRRLGVDPRSSVRGALLRFGSTTGIELLEYTRQGRAGEAPANDDHSAAHLALRVRDIDGATEHLRARGDVQVYEGPNEIEEGPSSGIRWVFFRAPWGLALELVELPEAHLEHV